MGGIDRSIEAIAKRERLIAVASLVAASAVAWIWLWLMAADMASPSVATAATAATMAIAPGFEPIALSLTFAMWVVMMAGMMLPSATPAILLYGTLRRRHGEQGNILPGIWVFAGGYLLAWTAFSVLATLMQATLETYALLDAGMTSTSRRLSAGLFIAAGLYQLTPLKLACLSRCSSPLQFFLTHWRDGAAGAVRMGFVHGIYCIGCCWALMLLLFAAGVMNLAWVAVLSAFVLVEKAWPSRVLSRASGVLLLAFGIWRMIAAE